MSIKKIDAHAHIAQWYCPDGTTAFDAVRQYLRRGNLESIDNMCCSSNSNLWGGFERDQSILAAIVKLEVPETYAHGCMFIPTHGETADPKLFDYAEQTEMLMAMGFDGIKICEFKPDSYKYHKMDSLVERFESCFSYCEKHDVPMCWHVADPDSFWDADRVPESAASAGWFYGDGTYPEYNDLYLTAYGILDRHPNLRVVLAHAFFLSNAPERMRGIFEKYPNVSIDLAPGWEMFDGFREQYEAWGDIFRTYSDRILMATDGCVTEGLDFPLTAGERVAEFLTGTDITTVPWGCTIHGIGLEKAHANKIMYENCRRIVGDAPKQIDRAVLREYIKRYLPIVPESRNTVAITEYYKKNLM